MISIKQLNHSFARVTSDDKEEILKIYNYFSYLVDGYQFMPLFKTGRWDGKVKLYNFIDKTLAIGLIPELIKFCKDKGIEYDVTMFPRTSEKVTEEEILAFVKTLGMPFELRDYQIKTIIEGINKRRLCLVSSTSSGKSAAIYVMVRYFLECDKRVFMIVPNISLIHQMKADFISYGWNEEEVNDNMHVIFGGQEKAFVKPVILSTWQSIHKPEYMAAYSENYDVVILDEAHLLKNEGQKIGAIVEKFVNAEWKIGLTGSLPKQIITQKHIESCLGPTVDIIKASELVAAGYATDLSITSVFLEYPVEALTELKESRRNNINSKKKSSVTYRYNTEEDFINSYEPKLNFIVKLILSKMRKNENVVVFFKRVQYGKRILEAIKQYPEFKDKVSYVDGSVHGLVRESIRQDTETAEGTCIVCSFKTFSTGINIKKIHSGIYAESPGKSDVTLIQSLGRFLRQHKDKDMAYIYDIVDDLRTPAERTRNKPKEFNYMLKHFIERMEVYRDQGWFISEKTYSL